MSPSRQSSRNAIYNTLTWGCGLTTLCIVVFIFFFLSKESLSALNQVGLQFITDKSWYPTENQWGIMPIVVGTFFASFGALLLAIPLGLFSALFCLFYAPKSLQWSFQRIIELFSGIPSVIFGFWGLVVVVPAINRIQAPGQSLLAAIAILSLMIFPILSLNMISTIQLFCDKNQKTSEALGISNSTFISKILWPNLRPQFFSSTLLCFARAIGETMAVLMVCGNIPQIPDSVFKPIRTLTSNIALEMSYAMDIHRSALFVSGLLLLAGVTTITLASHTFEKKKLRNT